MASRTCSSGVAVGWHPLPEHDCVVKSVTWVVDVVYIVVVGSTPHCPPVLHHSGVDDDGVFVIVTVVGGCGFGQ